MDAIVINPKDNVAVALREIAPGELVIAGAGEIKALERIPYGHKIARKDIPHGGPILKYGMTVGKANTDIPQGALVHVHNVSSVFLNNVQDHHE